jgi:hypothetical protein
MNDMKYEVRVWDAADRDMLSVLALEIALGARALAAGLEDEAGAYGQGAEAAGGRPCLRSWGGRGRREAVQAWEEGGVGC